MVCDLIRIKTDSNSNNNYNSHCCCPSCGEAAGKNFSGSGSEQITFNCLKCGKKKKEENYYKCNKCNSIFCIQCPYLKNGIIAESHSYEGSYGGNVAGGLLGA